MSWRLLFTVSLTVSAVAAPEAEAAPSPASTSVLRAESPTPAAAQFPKGGLMELLPRATDLGDGWSGHLDLLVDPQCQPTEYFPPTVSPELQNRLKRQIQPHATCQMRYMRGGSQVFEAWLTRLRNDAEVAARRKSLTELPMPPADSQKRRRTVVIDPVETIVFEGPDGSTLWVCTGSYVLSLNLLRQSAVPEEFLKTAALFVQKLTSPGPPRGAGATKEAAAIHPPSGGKRVVQPLEGLYVPVEDGRSQQVRLSAPRRARSEPGYDFSITNAEDVPIVVWNVRLQVRNAAGSDGGETWETVSSGYPSSVSAITPGSTRDERVVPPDGTPWRLCLLYTKQTSLGAPGDATPPRSLGEFELVSDAIGTGRR